MNKVKNVLITGGIGGIGFDICKYFINKNFNLTYNQLKTILDTLGCERDKNNPVKYILKNNKVTSREFLVTNNKNINSPFSVLEKLTIN